MIVVSERNSSDFKHFRSESVIMDLDSSNRLDQLTLRGIVPDWRRVMAVQNGL